jgi:2-polyprenyl-3-methyl-5-hydroxy-6-metoxy-1,4-benzoquinol methylase
MKTYFNKVKENTKRKIKIFLLREYMFLHNHCYKKISKWGKKLEGVHPKHRIINYHQFFVDNIDPSDEILDIGHGNGMLAKSVAKKAKSVVGIDINYPQKEKVEGNLTLLQGDATTYNFNKKIDKIILSNVLEHIENRIDFLKKLHNISDTILIRVPMINRDWVVLYKKEMGVGYKLDKTHFIEYTEESLNEELEKSNWKLGSYKVIWGELYGIIKTNENII